jgi:hypothetical protein
MRIAPYPSRVTGSPPPMQNTPLDAAGRLVAVMQKTYRTAQHGPARPDFAGPLAGKHGARRQDGWHDL